MSLDKKSLTKGKTKTNQGLLFNNLMNTKIRTTFSHIFRSQEEFQAVKKQRHSARGYKWSVALTHQLVDVFLCDVNGKQPHEILPQVSVQLRLNVELVLKTSNVEQASVTGTRL